MAELEDLESHLSSMKKQNASLFYELDMLKHQLAASASLPGVGGASSRLERPDSAPIRFRYLPSKAPESAHRLGTSPSCHSLRHSASVGSVGQPTRALAPELLDFLNSVGRQREPYQITRLPGPAPVYSPKKPGPPSMTRRYAPKENTIYPPPRKPSISRSQSLQIWADEQTKRREELELRWKRQALEASSAVAALQAQRRMHDPSVAGGALARQLKERSFRARLPEQTVTIAGVQRPATAQIGQRRMPLTRAVERHDAAERRIWSLKVRGWEEPSAGLAAIAGDRARDPAEAAAEVHAAHAAAMAGAKAAREASAVGSSGEMLQLDREEGREEWAAGGAPTDGYSSDSSREGAEGGVARADAADLFFHRAKCQSLLEVMRGWDTRGKCKLDRGRFEFMLSTLEPHVAVAPTLLEQILQLCDGREPDVVDLRLFCETLALPCHAGLVRFTGELVPNAQRGLRSTKDLPLGSNPLGPPVHPAPWAEPYGDGSLANVNLALRFDSPQSHLLRVDEALRGRDLKGTGELPREAFAAAIHSLNLFLSAKEMESLVRDADKAASGNIDIGRFVDDARRELEERGHLPVLLMAKHHRSHDMHQSLNWSTDEHFTEREGKYEIKRWLRQRRETAYAPRDTRTIRRGS